MDPVIMKFDRYFPTEQLRPYIKYFVVSESEVENTYKVFPTSGLVIGLQYKGKLSTIKSETENQLDLAGITGISESFSIFKNSAHIGTILVYFTEIGFTYFSSLPANELFNLSISLDYIFQKGEVNKLQENLASIGTDKQRLKLVEQFFLSQLKDIKADRLIIEAVRLIYESKGSVRIKELNEKLCISQSPLEKRFRKIVGTTPKKFASIVRFNDVLDKLNHKQLPKSVTKTIFLISRILSRTSNCSPVIPRKILNSFCKKRFFTIPTVVGIAFLHLYLTNKSKKYVYCRANQTIPKQGEIGSRFSGLYSAP